MGGFGPLEPWEWWVSACLAPRAYVVGPGWGPCVWPSPRSCLCPCSGPSPGCSTVPQPPRVLGHPLSTQHPSPLFPGPAGWLLAVLGPATRGRAAHTGRSAGAGVTRGCLSLRWTAWPGAVCLRVCQSMTLMVLRLSKGSWQRLPPGPPGGASGVQWGLRPGIGPPAHLRGAQVAGGFGAARCLPSRCMKVGAGRTPARGAWARMRSLQQHLLDTYCVQSTCGSEGCADANDPHSSPGRCALCGRVPGVTLGWVPGRRRPDRREAKA